nr:hypothetical protein [Mycobacterium sp.]
MTRRATDPDAEKRIRAAISERPGIVADVWQDDWGHEFTRIPAPHSRRCRKRSW